MGRSLLHSAVKGWEAKGWGNIWHFGKKQLLKPRMTASSLQPSASVALALGSNQGDRMAALQAAIKALAPYVQIEKTSPVYETPAVYVEDQPLFLNAVLTGTTKLTPLALLWNIKQ